MNDPWDDAPGGNAGFIVTRSGLRVPTPRGYGGPQGAAVTVPPTAAGRPSRRAAAIPHAAASFRGVGPKGYRRTDQRVRELVSEQLYLDPLLDASGIVVAVSRGRVSLRGRVPSERMREAAIAAARAVAGEAVDAELRVEAARVSAAARRAAARRPRMKARGRKRVVSR